MSILVPNPVSVASHKGGVEPCQKRDGAPGAVKHTVSVREVYGYGQTYVS